MIYSGGPIEDRAAWEAWFNTAFRYVKSAKTLLDQDIDVADYVTKHAVELSFKGLIESKTGSVPSHFLGGQEGHSILDLWEFVTEHKWVSETEIPRAKIVTVSHTDFADPDTGDEVVNCITGMIAHEKYPFNGRPPHEYMDPAEVSDLVGLCEEVIDILYDRASE